MRTFRYELTRFSHATTAFEVACNREGVCLEDLDSAHTAPVKERVRDAAGPAVVTLECGHTKEVSLPGLTATTCRECGVTRSVTK
jgi:hypothetical protein